MSKIEKIILQHCPDGVEYLKLGQVIKLEKGKQLNKELLTEFGDYPAYNGGLSYSGFTDKFNYEENKIIISQGGASAGFVNYVTTKFYANAHCYVVLPNVEIVLNRYVFHFLKLNQENLTSKQHGAGIPALRTSEILQIPIPIPPLPIQQEIVTILDKFTALEAELEAELEARSRQYEYYRNQLLAFEGKEVEWKAIGDVADLKAGKSISASKISSLADDKNRFICIGGNGIRGFVEHYSHEGNFPIIGRQGALCGNLFFASGKFYATEHAVVVKPLQNENKKFLYYLLKSLNLNQFATGGAQPGLAVTNLNKIKIPIPSLEEQERIVNILDQFDALVNDIKTGLPAEIKARRAQYEYYRKKLLTFSRVN